MVSAPIRQQDRVISLLQERGIVRLSELTEVGITAATVSRMKEKGLVLRLGRGLYQLPETLLDVNHSLRRGHKNSCTKGRCLSDHGAGFPSTDGQHSVPRLDGDRTKRPAVPRQPPSASIRSLPGQDAPLGYRGTSHRACAGPYL